MPVVVILMATDHPQKRCSAQNPPPPPSSATPPPVSSASVTGETGSSTSGHRGGQRKIQFPNPAEGHKIHYPNPPDATNPDLITLREQWRYVTRLYSRWYSRSWGTAILGGCSLFALGWIVKGSNPLPPRTHKDSDPDHHHPPDSH